MKPLMLSVQAFGPFADKQLLDFTQLGSNPLFLINGSTGAGKSTLLDAMCFALYGQTSGKERDAAQMRCDHASPDVLTEVNLLFALGDAIYKIQRQPMQERAKARGEGTTTQQTEANLWQIENTQGPLSIEAEGTLLVSKSAQNVNAAINDLIGLEVDQFRQVMILPQGKFRDFLLADSNQREAIFSTLFQTKIYNRLQEKLVHNARELEKDYETVKNQRDYILKEANADTAEALLAQAAEHQHHLTLSQQFFDQTKVKRDHAFSELDAANKLQQRFKQLQIYEQNLSSLASQQTTIASLQQTLDSSHNAEKIAHIYTALNTNVDKEQLLIKNTQDKQTLLNRQIANTQQAQQALAELREQKDSIEQKRKELNQLQSLLPKVGALSQAATAHKNALQKQAEIETQKNNLEQQRSAITSEYNSNNQNREQLAIDIAQLPDLKIAVAELNNLCVLRKDLDALYINKNKLIAEIEGKNRQLQQCEQQGKAERSKLQTLEYTWHSQQAAELARQLNIDEPCPVCGSTNHPAPAQLASDTAVTKVQLEQQQLTIENLREDYSKLKADLSALNASQSNCENDIQKTIGKLGENAELSTQTINQQLSDKQQALTHYSQQQATFAKLEHLLKKLQLELNTIDEAIKINYNDWNKAQTEVALASKSYNDLLEQLAEPWRTSGNLEQAMATLSQAITQYDTALDKAQNNDQQQQLQLNTVQVELKSAIDQLTELQALMVTQKDQWNSALASSAFTDEANFIAAKKTPEQQQNYKTQISQYSKQVDELNTLIDSEKAALGQTSHPDIASLELTLQTTEQQLAEAQSQWQQSKAKVDGLHSAIKSLDKIDAQFKKIEAKFNIVGTLAQAANGKNGKNLKLTNFVSGVLLDDVLIEASNRLIKMSKGRYRLLRNLERAKGNRASGLELLIEDNYTGKTRSAATLSGGESFLAALSLALGLTDVVQAYAGGITLDALFIDEGFGSLDQEALELAINTLIDLQSSGKMIGIISHVTELKEQMALRVDIKSSTNGSEIVVHH